MPLSNIWFSLSVNFFEHFLYYSPALPCQKKKKKRRKNVENMHTISFILLTKAWLS
jgi:hypothetical protein